MRRKTKPRVVWLPPDQSLAIASDPDSGYSSAIVSVSAAVPSAVTEMPLVIDSQQFPATSSLSDVENSGYRLRRIVGKIFIIGDAFDDETTIEAVLVKAAIIVRRTASDGSTSLAIGATPNDAANPSKAENWPDPWIWQRTWILGNPNIPPLGPQLPTSNVFLTTEAGPHVDQKTARIIGPEERLFLDVSATALFFSGVAELTQDIQIVTDLRVLGTMKNNAGNRRNASR